MHTDAAPRETRTPTSVARRVPPWVGDLLAAVLIVAAAFAPSFGHEFRATSVLGFVVVLLPALFLPLRRRWPIVILAACIVCFGVAASTGTVAPGPVLATAIAMFGVATRSPRRATIITAVVAIIAIVVLGLLATLGGVFDPRTFQFAVTVAFAAAAGDATRSRRAYIQAITDRAERAEATREFEAQRRVTVERLRIARDLHDAVAHQIAVISLNAGVASSSLEARPEKTKEALATIREASRTVLAEIGMLLTMLRTDDLDAGDVALPQPGLDRLDELLRRFRDAGLDVGLRVDGALPDLSPGIDIVAYRVLQESLTNAHKHGVEHRAHVLIAPTPDTLRIVITNPVAAEPSTRADSGGGLGLIGLRERVVSVGGIVETGMVPGGFRVDATLPLTAAAPDAGASS